LQSAREAIFSDRAPWTFHFGATSGAHDSDKENDETAERTQMSRLTWRWWPWGRNNSSRDAVPAAEGFEDGARRQLLQALSAMAAGGALATTSRGADAKDSSELPPPKRALTGRDEAGKSVFKSFDVTPKVVEIDANPGLTFYELYMTEGVPRLTGTEADPMLSGTKAFPGPGGTMFRLISYPPRRPEGWKPPPGVTFESGLKEMTEKIPGMGDHFERGAPGMHTSDTIDYGVVVRGEMTLELDDGQKIHLRQGDCIVQNGTRHRWRNPLTEPCLMAFISIGGKRG
jgi:quercetin dioxygenase-like cupin family protein